MGSGEKREGPGSGLAFEPARTQREDGRDAEATAAAKLRHKRKQPRTWRGHLAPPSAQAFPWLDEHFLEEAKAGMPDDELSRRSSLPLATIVRWRRDRGIKRPVGKAKRMKARAMLLVGTEFQDVMHRAENSSVKGRWEVPEYVLRVPLEYGEFARCVWFLHHALDMNTKKLAAALGVRARDISLALDLYEHYLSNHGTRCRSCGLKILQGRHCSTMCKPVKLKDYYE